MSGHECNNVGRQQRGFTLIEMVNTILILSILAIVVIVKFIDLTDQAEIARGEANVGALRSAMAIYYSTTPITTGTAQFPPDQATLEEQMLWSLEWEEGGGYVYTGP